MNMSKPRPTGHRNRKAPDDTFMNGHIVPWLLQHLAATSRTGGMSDALIERAAQHLAECSACRAELAALGAAAALNQADLVECTHPESTPSDEDLAFYAAYASLPATERSGIPAERYQTVENHLNMCVCCRALVEETLEMLVPARGAETVVAPGAQPAAVPHPAVAAVEAIEPIGTAARGKIENPIGIWESLSGARRLIAGYIVHMRENIVRISSTLATPQIATELAQTIQTTWRNAPATPGSLALQEQSFTVDLHDDTMVGQPWVQVRAHLQALSNRRTSIHLTAQHLTQPGTTGKAAPGVAWRLELHAPDGVSKALKHGATDDRGLAAFYVREFGDYTLTFDSDGFSWAIPLSIHPDTTASSALNS